MKSKIEGLEDIKLLFLDVDGVLTSGTIVYDSSGNEYKFFNVHDGHGIRLAKENGIEIAFVSGRSSKVVEKRADELGVSNLYQGVRDKTAVFNELLKKYKIEPRNICVIGDDLLDIELIKKAGVGVAVHNAPNPVKIVADYVTTAAGGNGAVREIVDMLLEAKDVMPGSKVEKR